MGKLCSEYGVADKVISKFYSKSMKLSYDRYWYILVMTEFSIFHMVFILSKLLKLARISYVMVVKSGKKLMIQGVCFKFS